MGDRDTICVDCGEPMKLDGTCPNCGAPAIERDPRSLVGDDDEEPR
jgi:hypothetical protein